MNSNLDALKEVYKALGGQLDDVALITELDDMIAEIADLLPGGDLPAVTAAQEGYVLTVDSNGKWVAAEPAAAKAG